MDYDDDENWLFSFLLFTITRSQIKNDFENFAKAKIKGQKITLGQISKFNEKNKLESETTPADD